MSRWLVRGLRGYQLVISPILHLFGGGCRFEPTCSQYAILAVERDGAVRGGWRAFLRLLRCHPFSTGGFDPP